MRLQSRVLLRGLGGLALAIVLGACDRRALTPTDETGGSGRIGGAPGGGQNGGATGGAGQGHTPGGADGGIDFSTRASILAPLGTADMTVDQATGAALFDLARGIGYAHGYAYCTCLVPSSETLSGESLYECARSESGVTALFEPAVARCILERSRELPEFDEYLRCETKATREFGRAYAECAMGTNTPPEPAIPCRASDSVDALLNGDVCRSL